MRPGRLIVLAICILSLVIARGSRPIPVSAQATCTVALGDGTSPLEVDPSRGPGTCGFLQFSWQAFLAMNWPPLAIAPANTSQQSRGLPDHANKIGQNGDNPTVWEQYQPNWYLFSPNNPPPAAVDSDSFAAWNQHAALPASCGPKNLTAGSKILSSLSKFDPMPGVVQASGQPLIDQDGYYARYEIRLSYQTFNYINKNQFYRKSAQLPATTFAFPVQSGPAPGAIFVKAAWKVLSPAERASNRFHKANAWMFTPGASGSSVGTTCVGPVDVGLVGLHIVQKTAQFPQQIWATFEHVDNAPADPAHPGTQTHWSFFDAAQSSKPDNQQPTCPSPAGNSCDWQPTSAHVSDATGGPTKAVRKNPIPSSQNQPALDQINESARVAFRQISAQSVWQFYKLVEAQWQRPDTPTGFFPPTNVANLTMETYSQPNSCMACHKFARGANNVPSDMSFELRLAWDPVVIPNPIP
jgi:hypothetical protein